MKDNSSNTPKETLVQICISTCNVLSSLYLIWSMTPCFSWLNQEINRSIFSKVAIITVLLFIIDMIVKFFWIYDEVFGKDIEEAYFIIKDKEKLKCMLSEKRKQNWQCTCCWLLGIGLAINLVEILAASY